MAASISIALATYEGAAHLSAQLDSFAAQARLPGELVVSDDCSSDETVALVEAFAARAPFEVRILTGTSNVGYIRNFSRAIEHCRGDLIFLSDQDDVWLPEKLAVLEKHMQAHPEAMLAVCDLWICDGELNRIVRKSENTRRLGLRPSSIISGCATVMRKELAQLATPIPADAVAHDQWIHNLARALDARSYVDEPLVLYRRHGLNVSNALSSSTTPVRRFGALFRAREVRSLWLRHATSSAIVAERLSERHDRLAATRWARRADRAIAVMRKRERAFRRRSELATRTRLARLLPALRLLAGGGYRGSGGVVSLALDLIRPRESI